MACAGSRVHEQRAEARFECAFTVARTHTEAYDRPIEAQVVEISRSGLQLHLKQPLAIGSLITIEMAHVTVMGEVRHCDSRPGDSSYTVGLRTWHIAGEPAWPRGGGYSCR